LEDVFHIYNWVFTLTVFNERCSEYKSVFYFVVVLTGLTEIKLAQIMFILSVQIWKFHSNSIHH